jgi:hypothetical protein
VFYRPDLGLEFFRFGFGSFLVFFPGFHGTFLP